jgi:hypothetical protein
MSFIIISDGNGIVLLLLRSNENIYFYSRFTFEEKVRRKYFEDLIPPTIMADLFPVSSPDLINLLHS